MLLQCAIESHDADGAAGWLRDTTLASVSELNMECLELCAQQAQAAAAAPLCSEIAQLWSALDAPARRRATGCHYLLLDAGLADLTAWPSAGAPQIADAAREYAPWFTVPAAASLAQAVFTFAWHLARSQGSAARLLLGMPASCVHELAQHTLGQARLRALLNPGRLRPRWATQPRAWRALLAAAALGDAGALERARLRGQTLLAAEARLAMGSERGVRRTPPAAPACRPGGITTSPGNRAW